MTRRLPPARGAALLVRTDFTDSAAWHRLRRTVATPSAEGFTPVVAEVDDPAFAGLGVAALTARLPPDHGAPLLVLADRRALADPELPLLAADLRDPAAPALRVAAAALWSVENNLSLANLDYADFLRAAGADGVFRGF
ncbi:DUF6924 domain-containing protein [Kitasatospora cheerisanensis]|uniref:DUF6924 domain-containing protein n=1 Tax=Kitasatospora cheerisanensis KCTC 2395 TaxID=1348663 RepID=A0A066Z7L3_9ACTN|nr:hypothetical protein [Kitasatospora cheerisanensis]KDN86321.1 hypothetical protein KCH_21380 [Kitasatospora cheerisanensis KCTC 2395]